MKKIMVIDDDSEVLSSTENLLKINGYEVIIAKSVNQGLNKLKSATPDLILLDLIMPGKSVSTFLEKVVNIKIVVFSVVPVSEIESEKSLEKLSKLLKQKNIVDKIVKPFDNKDLLIKIKKHLSV